AVTILSLRHEGLIRNALVIDCDVHQGNGTAEILGNDPDCFTFSIHGEKNFPLRKHPSSLDIDLPDGTTDEHYLSELQRGLQQCIDSGHYDLMIYLAGADPYEGDRLGRLKLTKPGLIERDRRVLQFAQNHSIPVAIAMAGGYAQNVNDIVDIHAATVATAKQFAQLL
ncbi:MAG: histone deacetylase, partial [Pirellula sp.]